MASHKGLWTWRYIYIKQLYCRKKLATLKVMQAFKLGEGTKSWPETTHVMCVLGIQGVSRERFVAPLADGRGPGEQGPDKLLLCESCRTGTRPGLVPSNNVLEARNPPWDPLG